MQSCHYGDVCLPVGLREAQADGLSYSQGENKGFRPAQATRCIDSCETWMDDGHIWVRLAVQNFTLIGAGDGNAAPKISMFSFW